MICMRWVRCLVVTLGAGTWVFVGGCAAPLQPVPDKPVVAEVPAKVVRPPVHTKKQTPTRPPVSKQSPTPQPAASSRPAPPADTTTPPSTPKPDTDPAPLVRGGVLESGSPQQLVFVRTENPPQTSSPGLYEDAIILSALRAALKAVGGAEVAESARVSAGEVTLDVPAQTEKERVAAFVDAAFAVPEVRRVAVNLH
jgi:hypothetical protein